MFGVSVPAGGRARREGWADDRRAFANSVIAASFRNLEIEDIHWGDAPFIYPFGARRIAPEPERRILRDAACRLMDASVLLDEVAAGRSDLGVLTIVMAAGGVPMPSNWSIEKTSCRVRLAGMEPADPATPALLQRPAHWDD